MSAKKLSQTLAIMVHLLLWWMVAGCAAVEAGVVIVPAATPTPITTPSLKLEPVLPSPVFTKVQVPQSPTPAPLTTAPISPTTTPMIGPTSLQAVKVTSCTCGQTTCPCGIDHVVIISVDGLRPDAIEATDTVTFDMLRTQGAYSPLAQAVLPSVTLVNHASMLGGMSPAKHGIYWNVNDPELGKVKGPTLFSVAHEAGLSTAMVVGKPKLEHLVLPNSVDNYIYAGFLDQQVASEAVAVIETSMPDLLFIHLPGVDSAGHALGWMSPGQLLALNLTDSLIGEIVATLKREGYLSQTLMIITADHGGSGFKHGSSSPADMRIPWLAVGPGVPAGVTLQRKIVTYDTAATALYVFGLPIPESWDGQPVMEIFEQASQ